MKYLKPTYEKEMVETIDILLESVQSGIVDFGNGAILTQVSQDSAQVGASAFDVLGLR